jgi:Ca2+/Na+ antiporter
VGESPFTFRMYNWMMMMMINLICICIGIMGEKPVLLLSLLKEKKKKKLSIYTLYIFPVCFEFS